MEHHLYKFDPLPFRETCVWPGDSRLASCLVLYLEAWELSPPADALRDPRFNDAAGYFFPDYRTYSWREYGNRVGIFRILELLDRHNLPVTIAANADAIKRYPFLVEQLVLRGYEFAAHGTVATRMISSAMNEDQEYTYMAESRAAVISATGKAPTGWVSQDFGESTRTPYIAAKAGFRYILDWANDDQPYRLTTEPSLASIPNQVEWDDVQLLWHRRVPLESYGAIVCRAFDRLHMEAATSGRYFGLHIHPWLLGAPHRIHQLELSLDHISTRQDVWHATASEIADHCLRGEAK